jgi:hypothetical protein
MVLYRDFSSYPDFAVLTVSIDQRAKPLGWRVHG